MDTAALSAETPFRQYVVGTSVLNTGTTSANAVAGGVFPGGGAMAVSAGSGLAVNVAAGYCCVPAASAIQGGYIFGAMTEITNLTLAAADPTNPRIDLIVAYVNDLGTSASAAYVQTVTGTPASSPSAPTPPTPSIVLAEVQVNAGAASLTSGNITDERTYVVAPGGILPIANSGAAPAVPATQLMYNIAAGTIVQGTGTAGSVASLPVLPWVPVMAQATSNVTDSSAKGVLTTIATTSTFVCDGSTDVEIYYKWTGFTVSTAPLLVTLEVKIDSTVVDQTVVYPASSSVFSCGGSARYYTSSGSNRPIAGSHTVTFSFQSASSSFTTTLSASSTAAAVVRVTPVAT
jgi:hypothetical protein